VIWGLEHSAKKALQLHRMASWSIQCLWQRWMATVGYIGVRNGGSTRSMRTCGSAALLWPWHASCMARHQQTNKPLHVYSAPTLHLLFGSPHTIRTSALSAASSVSTLLIDTLFVSADCSRHRRYLHPEDTLEYESQARAPIRHYLLPMENVSVLLCLHIALRKGFLLILNPLSGPQQTLTHHPSTSCNGHSYDSLRVPNIVSMGVQRLWLTQSICLHCRSVIS
jgi:hypothetical protein